jgi:hypothetical protein
VRGPGELVLPPFVAKVKDGEAAASTPEQVITVASSLAGEGAAIEAPGQPLPSPSRSWVVAAFVAAAVWLLAGALVLARRKRGVRPPRVETALPPHVKAQRALARLRTVPRGTEAEVERFYVEVSDVLRTYVEERFGLRAPERTTEEFLRELESGDALAQKHRRELERFLLQCDLVKFAAAQPGEREHIATWELAETFVTATAADREAVEVPA